MKGCLELCEQCPIEKTPNGSCYDPSGTWKQVENNSWAYEGLWKCNFYNKEMDLCDCPMEMNTEMGD
jgi:hypothetical protein